MSGSAGTCDDIAGQLEALPREMLLSQAGSGEWPGGVAPPGSRRTRREGLPSPGSHRPT